MLGGIARVIEAFAGIVGLTFLWAIVFPVVLMIVTLYVIRLIPLTGQWRKRLRERLSERFRSS